MPDQPGVAQFGQRTDVLGERRGAERAEVHHVEVVTAEGAQVLLDLAAQLFGARPGQPRTGRVAAGTDLGDDDRSSGYGASAVLISSLAERSAEK